MLSRLASSKAKARIKARASAHAKTWAILLAVATLACAPGRTPEIEMGAGAEVTTQGLHRVRNSRYEDTWVKPDAGFANYTQIMFELGSISYERKPRSGGYGRTRRNFALNDHQLARLERYFVEAFEAELAGHQTYRLVDAPGPRTLRVKLEIVDLVVAVPQLQDLRGNEKVFTSSSAELTLVIELRDSLSGEILSRATDRREARPAGYFRGTLYQSNAVRNTDAFKRVFRGWARILRARLDAVHAKPAQEPHSDDT